MSFDKLCLEAMLNQDRTINDKLATRALLRCWGFPTAQTIAYVPRAEMLEPYLTDPVVVKPRNGSTSHGVMLLEPNGEAWHDRLWGKDLTFPEIVDECRYWEERFDWRRGYLIEKPHYLNGEIGIEYRVYTFGGKVGVIQGDRLLEGKRTYGWWADGWVVTGKNAGKLDPDFPPPPSEVGPLAEEVAAHLPWLGFLRVDVFVTDEGLMIGELADHVGDRWFNKVWDKRLGKLWEQALS